MLETPEFWIVQNTVLTETGWVCLYPPLHTLLLAGGLAMGVPWIVGPIMLGITATFSTLLAHRLLPDRPLEARVGGLLLAVSPFLLFLGSGYLSHSTAAGLAALCLYCAVRARDGSALLLARDLGPQRNRLLLTRFPERTPYLYLPLGQGRPPSLVPYREGMELIWNGR